MRRVCATKVPNRFHVLRRLARPHVENLDIINKYTRSDVRGILIAHVSTLGPEKSRFARVSRVL